MAGSRPLFLSCRKKEGKKKDFLSCYFGRQKPYKHLCVALKITNPISLQYNRRRSTKLHSIAYSALAGLDAFAALQADFKPDYVVFPVHGFRV